MGETQFDELNQHGRSEIADYITGQGIVVEPFETIKISPTNPAWRGRIARYVRDLPPGTKPFKSADFDKRISEMLNDLDSAQTEHLVASAVASGA